MSEPVDAKLARRPFGASAWIIVAALIAGLLAGAVAEMLQPAYRDVAVSVVGTIGGLWVDALKMVVIPLVVALLVKGIVGSAEIASEGRIATLAVAWFLGLYAVSAVISFFLVQKFIHETKGKELEQMEG